MPALFWRISQPAFQVWLGRSEPEWSNCLVDATQSEHTLTHVLLNDDLRCSVCHECIYWEPVSHGISTSLKFWAHGNHRLGPRKPKETFFATLGYFRIGQHHHMEEETCSSCVKKTSRVAVRKRRICDREPRWSICVSPPKHVDGHGVLTR